MQDWLFWAVSSYSTKADGLIEDAIEKKPYLVREKTHLGETVLHQAAKYQRITLMGFLLSKGADPYLEDDLGKTVFDLAKFKAYELLDDYIYKLEICWANLNKAIQEKNVERVRQCIDTLPINSEEVRNDILMPFCYS